MVFARFVCFSDHVLFPVSCIGPFDELPWDLDISRTLYSPMYSLIWYTIAGMYFKPLVWSFDFTTSEVARK